MPTILLVTAIAAPIERVFDLSLSIDLHVDSTSRSGERAVAGVVTGLIGLDEEVTWRARHFGVWQTLTTRITRLDRPNHFRDSMVRGTFRRFDHDHFFEPTPAGTSMRDVFDYESPLGLLGRAADVLFLQRHLQSFLVERNRVIREAAESDAWRKYLEPGSGGPASPPAT